MTNTNLIIRYSTLIIALFIVFFNMSVIFFPQSIVEAAREGLLLWFLNVLPALLPFIIGINLLLALGVIDFIGRLFAPLMGKCFNVPGVGGFAMVVGFTSGYPMGAKVVSDLRNSNKITKNQAERLIAFCNNSGPLFILGTISTMFQSIAIGHFVLIVHYFSSIITGFLFKYYKYRDDEKYLIEKQNNNKEVINEHKVNINFASVFTDSVVRSVNTILTIGGFIVLFNVILEIVRIVFDIDTITATDHLLAGLLYGFIEITNGANYLASQEHTMPVVVATACILSFGGLSIHSQSISFISKTDINLGIYFFGKIVQTLVTLCLGVGLWGMFFL